MDKEELKAFVNETVAAVKEAVSDQDIFSNAMSITFEIGKAPKKFSFTIDVATPACCKGYGGIRDR
jgi:predicted nucleotide-binding protein